MPKIFEPFSAAKSAREGAGLRLSTGHGIIQQHSGEMCVENDEAAGPSIFNQPPIARPRTAEDEPVRQPAEAQLEEAADVPITRLLVVDDEPAILDLITRGLRDEINIIQQANSGETALEMIRNSDFDLILLDQKMPGVSGMEVFERIAASDLRTAERIVFMTGDTAGQGSAAFLAGGKNPVISKPFQLEVLKRIIGRVVSASHDP